MATTQENAEILRVTARQFKAIIELSEQLDTTKIDQMILEKEVALQTLDTQYLELELAVEKAKSDLAAIKKTAQKAVDDTKNTAATLTATASANAEKTKKEADAYLQNTYDEIENVQDEITVAKNALADLKKTIVEKVAEKTALEADIEAIKAKFN